MPKKTENPDPHYHVWLGDFALPATTGRWAEEWVNYVVHITGVRRDMLRVLRCRARWVAPTCVQAAERYAFIDDQLEEERDDVHDESAAQLDAMTAFRMEKERDDLEEVDYPPSI